MILKSHPNPPLGCFGGFLALINDAEAGSGLRAIAGWASRSNSAHFWRTGRTPNLAENTFVVALDSSRRRQLTCRHRFLPRAADVACGWCGQQQLPVGQHHQPCPTFFAPRVTESSARPAQGILGELMHALDAKP